MCKSRDELEQQLMLNYIYSQSDSERERILEELYCFVKPLLIAKVSRHLSFISSSDREDYYQVGQIEIWRILERLRREKQEPQCFSAYLNAAMKYTYIREFYKYIERYPVKTIIMESFYSHEENSARLFFMSDYLERYKQRRREYNKQYRARKKATDQFLSTRGE